MGWRIIQQPNSYYARFSERVDDFTEFNMTVEEAIILCIQDYGMGEYEAETKVQRAIEAGSHRWDEALERIKHVHGSEEAETRLRELSEEIGEEK